MSRSASTGSRELFVNWGSVSTRQHKLTNIDIRKQTLLKEYNAVGLISQHRTSYADNSEYLTLWCVGHLASRSGIVLPGSGIVSPASGIEISSLRVHIHLDWIQS